METTEKPQTQASLPELLAPAGNWDAFVAAVQNGADAVYLGTQDFNARQEAENFTLAQVEEAVSYAHARGVRIYITFNTLISDSELSQALHTVEDLLELGVDGFIVQDLGLSANLRLHFPELPLHASTQMTIHNSAGAEFLAQWGFTRLVAARELSLSEIRAIIQKVPGIEVEVFAHGALCFSYSGNCLLSSLIGGRSGNRGRCAQPCRLEYSLVNSEGKVLGEGEATHLLSPKDLNTLEHLEDLIKAGVHSLKIEGRMKRPEYVATVVKSYRRALDLLAAGVDLSSADLNQLQAQLEQIFNRSFTSGYLYGNPGRDLMSYTQPSNRGRFLGRVRENKDDLVWLKLEADLESGDGIEVWMKENGRSGGTVKALYLRGKKGKLEKVERAERGQTVGLKFGGPVHRGDLVYKNREAALLKVAESTYKSEHEVLKIPIEARVKATIGEPVEVVFCDGNRLCGIGRTEFLVEEALRHPTTEEMIKEQLSRLGNTPFTITRFEFELDPNIMIPKSELNRARREAAQNLLKLRTKFYAPIRLKRSVDRITQEYAGCRSLLWRGEDQPQVSVIVDSLRALESALEAGAGLIYLSDSGFDRKEETFSSLEAILSAVERCIERGSAGVFLLPPIVKEEELVYYARLIHGLNSAEVPVPVSVGDVGLIHLARSLGANFLANAFLNPFNSQTVNFLRCLGASQVTLSPELTLEQVRLVAKKSRVPLELLVHGPQVAMVSEHCVLGSIMGGRAAGTQCSAPCATQTGFGLKDRLGKVFSVRTDRRCRMYLFNSAETCLIEHLWEIHSAGINCLLIEGRLYTPEKLGLVVERYVEGWSKIYSSRRWDRGFKEMLAAFRRELEPEEGITKGHLFRGVM
ncbi:MAG: DUF3656 domain-containing protein [Firmicutes bacterium]|nr:DUF3656 domain-containing protein [Bacillota bacterium]